MLSSMSSSAMLYFAMSRLNVRMMIIVMMPERKNTTTTELTMENQWIWVSCKYYSVKQIHKCLFVHRYSTQVSSVKVSSTHVILIIRIWPRTSLTKKVFGTLSVGHVCVDQDSIWCWTGWPKTHLTKKLFGPYLFGPVLVDQEPIWPRNHLTRTYLVWPCPMMEKSLSGQTNYTSRK